MGYCVNISNISSHYILNKTDPSCRSCMFKHVLSVDCNVFRYLVWWNYVQLNLCGRKMLLNGVCQGQNLGYTKLQDSVFWQICWQGNSLERGWSYKNKFFIVKLVFVNRSNMLLVEWDYSAAIGGPHLDNSKYNKHVFFLLETNNYLQPCIL